MNILASDEVIRDRARVSCTCGSRGIGERKIVSTSNGVINEESETDRERLLRTAILVRGAQLSRSDSFQTSRYFLRPLD